MITRSSSSTPQSTAVPTTGRRPWGALRVLGGIFLHAATWQAQLRALALPPDPHVALVDLTSSQWRDPALRRLLGPCLLVAPVLTALVGLVLALVLGRADAGALAGWLTGLVLGIGAASCISVAVGAGLLSVAAPLLGLLWGGTPLVMAGIILGPHLGVTCGICCAVLIHVSGHLARRSPTDRLVRQVGGIVLGLLLSLVVVVATVGLLLLLIAGRQANSLPGRALGSVVSMIPALLLGVAAWWRTRRPTPALAVAAACFLTVLLLFGDTGFEYDRQPGGLELVVSIGGVIGALVAVLWILPYALSVGLVGPWPAAVAAALGSLTIHGAVEQIFAIYPAGSNLIIHLAFIVVGLAWGWLWSLLSYPLEAAGSTYLVQQARQSPARVDAVAARHPAFWDHVQRLPLFGLDDLLIQVYEHDEDRGRALLESVGEGRQRWAGQAAQIELDARRLEEPKKVADLAALGHLGKTRALLADPIGPIMRTFARLSDDTSAALKQPSPFNQRLVLRGVMDELDRLQGELIRSNTAHATRFVRVTHHWRTLLETHVAELNLQSLARQEIPNPYVVGVPLTRRQAIFVGRTDIARRIEDILRDQDHPPLLLYGQRRMGKTSLLYQLRWMLPSHILPLVVDLQGPISLASTHSGFLYNLAKALRTSAQRQEVTLPDLDRLSLSADPFTLFDDWLDSVAQATAAQGKSTLLLALDEFEALDHALRSGALDENRVLGLLRHLAQHRHRLKLLLAGSHTLDEFRRWSGHLINAQVIPISFLRQEQARQLIEQPMVDFPLAYNPTATRAILDLTNGHPYLVQLFCMEMVAFKNSRPPSQRLVVEPEEVEIVAPEMLNRGQQFFADIELNQVDDAERRFLIRLAQSGPAATVTDEDVSAAMVRRLVQRQLISRTGAGYRFQVEAVRRWFATEAVA